MSAPRLLLAAVTVLVALAASIVPASATTLQPQLLPSLGGGTALPAAANNNGVIVGSSTTSSGEFHAVVWRDGTIEDLGTLGGGSSEATAIDDQNRIVGSSLGADNRYHAVMWQQVTTTDRRRRTSVRWRISELATPGDGPWAEARDINRAGTIVGRYTVGQGFSAQFEGSRGFIWRGGALTTLDLTPGVQARAINDQDQVVGAHSHTLSTPGVFPAAFLWQNGVGRDLGTLGGRSSWAYDINNRAQVVGESGTADRRNAGFIWQDGVMRPLPIDRTDVVSYVAASINDAGNVAGTAAVPDTTRSRALFWSSPDAQPQTLAVPTGHLDATASAVTPQGWALGHAARLTPTSVALSAVVWR